MSHKSSLLMVSLLLLFIKSGLAQDYRGRVEGIVTDQTKSVIAGATVTLSNVNTGIKIIHKTSDTGLYLFDLVDPGSYSITVEQPGFGTFVQENIVVQTRGDVTVNAMLVPGAVQQSITINEAPSAVQFNSSNRDLTIDSKMATEIPRFDRNPFKLALIAPSAVNTRGEMQPFHSWSANSVDLGGSTNLKNDLQVDGMPIGMGQKNSTTPNTDAVQEVIVSTNSVDAESGHSAGGLISVTTRAGTNNFNAQRQNMLGGTLGNPILKNKLFNFFSLEYWKVGYPNGYARTVPTSAEAGGDFSHSLNIDGTLRTVWDPFSTQFNPTTGAVTRTPFANNAVPASRFDP